MRRRGTGMIGSTSGALFSDAFHTRIERAGLPAGYPVRIPDSTYRGIAPSRMWQRTAEIVVPSHSLAAANAIVPSDDLLAEVRKFGELKKEGLLTYDEFTQIKRRLLSL